MSYVPRQRQSEVQHITSTSQPWDGITPHYAPPDLDPDVTLDQLDGYAGGSYQEGYGSDEDEDAAEHAYDRAASISKRKREEEEGDAYHANQRRREDEAGGRNGQSNRNGRESSGHPQGPPMKAGSSSHTIQPSMFGISARNEITKIVGEFIMNNTEGLDNVEIEVKLGVLKGVPNHHGEAPHRFRFPTMSEMVLAPDYPIGGFSSTMSRGQHTALNKLLNEAVGGSINTPHPIRFRRERHIDTFHHYSASQRGGGKIRVSRDREGNVIPGGVIIKKRIADLNVHCPGGVFDWRISINTESPIDMPSAPPGNTREKDRACYKHQLCQVDLTVVTAREHENGPPNITHEIEVEVLNVPALLAEGATQSDRYDEMIQSILDTARMLIRSCPP